MRLPPSCWFQHLKRDINSACAALYPMNLIRSNLRPGIPLTYVASTRYSLASHVTQQNKGLSKMSDKTGSVFQDSDFLSFFGADDGISTGIDLCQNSLYQTSCDERWSQLAVYRVMFALTVFYLAMGVLTLGVKQSTDCRAGLQNGCWLIKIVILVGLMIAAFFIKNLVFTGAWSYVATVGACCFLLLQSIGTSIVADSWNESIKNQLGDTDDSCTRGKVKGLFWLVVFTSANIALTVVIFKFFTCDHDKTATNLATANLVIGILMHILALFGALKSARHMEDGKDAIPRVGLLQPAMVSFFMTYQTWSAVSETNQLCQAANVTVDATVNVTGAVPDMRANDITTTFLGMAWVLVIVAYMSRTSAPSQEDIEALATEADRKGNGSDDSEKGQQVVDDETDELTYSWWQFHFMLACGAMYVTCVITNWGRVSDDVAVIDDGALAEVVATPAFDANKNRAPIWIQATFSWLTGLFYFIWTIPPLITPENFEATRNRPTSQV